MKITFVIHGVGIAGGIRAVFECSNRLVERGHEVNIVYPAVLLRFVPNYSASLFFEQIMRCLGNLRRGANVDWFDVKANLRMVFSLSPKFLKFFQNFIPDSDVIITGAWEVAYALKNLDSRKGKKAYFVQHYEVWDMWNNRDCWRKFDEMDSDNSSRGIAMCDVVPSDSYTSGMKKLVDSTYTMPYCKITTSSWLKEMLETKFEQQVFGIVPIGNNFDIFGIPEYKKKKNRRLKILMSYRGIEWKGDEDGIKALKEVKHRYPEIEILFFGHIDKSKIPDWADYVDRPSDEELKKMYSDADIFVFPSWVEGWGSPPMEAMACGTACVTTNVGAVPDYSVPDDTAVVVPPRSPEKLAEAIISLIEDDEKRNRVAEKGFHYIRQFTWDNTVDVFEKSLQDIVNGAKG